MGSYDLSQEERLKRFLYTSSFHGAYITGNPDKHICKLSTALLFDWVKAAPDDFLKTLTTINDDPLVVRRANFFYITAAALHCEGIPMDVKVDIKEAVLKLVKSDEEFFDFIKYYTLGNIRRKQRISTSLKKMIVKFYKGKEPMQFAKSVTKQDRYHGWRHKDLIKLCHYKCDNVECEPIVKYVLFGPKQLPTGNDENETISYLKKCHDLRTTEDTTTAAALIGELHAGVDQANSKLNKNEEVWLASLSEMTTRELLQCLFRFYKFGFLKAGSHFQARVNELLSDPAEVKKSNLHPVEVFIHLKFFEKGGKVLDPKLLEYLQKKEIKEETLKKIQTPLEPKCKPVFQSINKCLKLSYDNVQPTGKKFMITIDVTEKTEECCFHNKRITFLEAAIAITRFLCKVEQNVTVAVFKDSQINFVDISKSHSAIDKLQEHKSAYIVPTAPIEWAKNKKKPVDVFINFMNCNWYSSVPADVKEKIPKLPESLKNYAQKMKLPETRVVKMFLGGPSASYTENSKNILSIAGFSVQVPRVLEAFCKGLFC